MADTWEPLSELTQGLAPPGFTQNHKANRSKHPQWPLKGLLTPGSRLPGAGGCTCEYLQGWSVLKKDLRAEPQIPLIPPCPLRLAVGSSASPWPQ